MLLALLISAEPIRVLVKRADQRTAGERKRVQNGLGRSVSLDFAIFVPATATLTWALSPLLPAEFGSGLGDAYGPVLGIASYGFPFRAVRAIVQHLALSTLRGFAAIADEEVRNEADEPESGRQQDGKELLPENDDDDSDPKRRRGTSK